MLLIFWNKCDTMHMVTQSAFYLLNTITKFSFPHDPAAISLINLAPNPSQMVLPLFLQIIINTCKPKVYKY